MVAVDHDRPRWPGCSLPLTLRGSFYFCQGFPGWLTRLHLTPQVNIPVKALDGSDKQRWGRGLCGEEAGRPSDPTRSVIPAVAQPSCKMGTPCAATTRCDLDALGTGARIGMMRTAKATCYFISGQDQALRAPGLPTPGKGDYSVAFRPATFGPAHPRAYWAAFRSYC